MEFNRSAVPVVEYHDRWLLKPLRGRSVSDILWREDRIELLLYIRSWRMVIGYDTELSPKSLAKNSPDRHSIRHWSRSEVEDHLSAPILSTPFFKSGAARLGFKNGWNLFTPESERLFDPELWIEDQLVWTPVGIIASPILEIHAVDPWTGRPVTPPHWPGRPENLSYRDDSDDIND
ncbi:MAG: hypothetical protein J2P18_08535 [Nocardia sp.]|nr:hypothetical protein [Nocardia sp.]